LRGQFGDAGVAVIESAAQLAAFLTVDELQYLILNHGRRTKSEIAQSIAFFAPRTRIGRRASFTNF
jgi:hypothetical protein